MLALACVACGCHGGAPNDGGVPDALLAAPAGFAQATLVELRDSVDEEGKRHDVVLRFEREGADFAWSAKVGRFDASLGERLPDPFLQRGPYDTPCVCAIDAVCACERAGPQAPEGKKGRVAAALVDALLAACAAEALAPTEADAGRINAGGPRRHLSAWAAATGDTHFSSTSGDPKWRANGQALVSGGAAIDGAFDKLLAAVGVPAWVGALNVVSPMTLPPGFAELDEAQVLEVNDQWNGLGLTHHVFLRLERKGSDFAWKAKLAAYPGSLAERLPDPYTPPDRDHTGLPCLCAVDASCRCEHARDVKKKSGTVAAAPVEAFLAAVASHGIDAAFKGPRGNVWTDDHPKAHVAVWSAPGADPVHLSFLDQQRRWRVNGHELTLDPEDTAKGGTFHGSHVKLNAAYQAMLTAIGLDKWIEELHPKATHR